MSDLPRQTDPEVQKKLDEIEAKANNPQYPHYTAVPQTGQVPEGGFVLATISGTSYLYSKINGVLKRVALS